MSGHDIIVIGASAGGVEALVTLVSALPPNLPAAIFVVLHIPAQSPSMLPAILNRSTALEAVQATDGAPIEHGRIYVAPPDHHLLVERDHICVVRGPKENRHRPAVDPLFRTAARVYGSRVVGVVLTGSLDDGTAGLAAVKQRGGVAIVQDPDEALYSGMPRSAIENVAIDYRLPLAGIAAELVRLADEPAQAEGAYPVTKDMVMESNIAKLDLDALHGDKKPGTPSSFSCPECGGVLWELHDRDLTRFRCRVGHAFSPESMLAEQNDTLESALWMALKTIEESASLSRRMAYQARERLQPMLAARFEAKLRDAEQRATMLRNVLMQKETSAGTSGADQLTVEARESSD